MLLTVDVGNTRSTWMAHPDLSASWDSRPRFVHGDKGLQQPEDPAALRAWLDSVAAAGGQLLHAAVAPRRAAELLSLAREAGVAHVVGVGDAALRLDLANLCREPERVGKDRLLAASEARARFGGAAIAVDVGTAITVDAVDETGAFRGGAIAPGPRLLARALRSETELLPEVALRAVPAERGRDTQSAIELSLFHGTAGMIDRLIAIVGQDLAPRGVLLCGGYAPVLSAALSTAHVRERDVIHRALVRLHRASGA
ncbi:MAG: type III pantothenate kinase [Planctomycetes bacterium]|nr:type III pantothenate kinase [Planctomycetota bacterium]